MKLAIFKMMFVTLGHKSTITSFAMDFSRAFKLLHCFFIKLFYLFMTPILFVVDLLKLGYIKNCSCPTFLFWFFFFFNSKFL